MKIKSWWSEDMLLSFTVAWIHTCLIEIEVNRKLPFWKTVVLYSISGSKWHWEKQHFGVVFRSKMGRMWWKPYPVTSGKFLETETGREKPLNSNSSFIGISEKSRTQILQHCPWNFPTKFIINGAESSTSNCQSRRVTWSRGHCLWPAMCSQTIQRMLEFSPWEALQEAHKMPEHGRISVHLNNHSFWDIPRLFRCYRWDLLSFFFIKFTRIHTVSTDIHLAFHALHL